VIDFKVRPKRSKTTKDHSKLDQKGQAPSVVKMVQNPNFALLKRQIQIKDGGV
jgi:hypothetical protein